MWIKYPVEIVLLQLSKFQQLGLKNKLHINFIMLYKNIHSIYHKWTIETNLAIYVDFIQIKHQIPMITFQITICFVNDCFYL
jgi:hypothetical protein